MQCAEDFMCGAFGYFDGYCWKYKKLLPLDASGAPVPDDKWGFPYSNKNYLPYDTTSDAYDFYSCWIKGRSGCDAGMTTPFIAEWNTRGQPTGCPGRARRFYKALDNVGEMSCVSACSSEAAVTGSYNGCVGMYWYFSGNRTANSTTCLLVAGATIKTCEYSRTTPIDPLTKKMSVACAR
jgi:hypothetical protein